MMRTLKFDFEFGAAAGGGHALSQAALLEHFQCTEHSDFADAFAFERLVDVVQRHMPLRVEQKIHNGTALVGQAQVLVGQIFLKDLVYPGRVAFPAGRPCRKKNKFLGGLSHWLIEMIFQYTLSGAARSTLSGFLF
jgi:hypothetical protein